MADSKQNFSSMKNEAVRSAKEMHQRNTIANSGTVSNQNQKHFSEQSAQNASDSVKNRNSNGLFGLAGGFFQSIGLSGKKTDNDKIIVILMIIMLAREGADLKLLLALGYILM